MYSYELVPKQLSFGGRIFNVFDYSDSPSRIDLFPLF